MSVLVEGSMVITSSVNSLCYPKGKYYLFLISFLCKRALGLWLIYRECSSTLHSTSGVLYPVENSLSMQAVGHSYM